MYEQKHTAFVDSFLQKKGITFSWSVATILYENIYVIFLFYIKFMVKERSSWLL